MLLVQLQEEEGTQEEVKYLYIGPRSSAEHFARTVKGMTFPEFQENVILSREPGRLLGIKGPVTVVLADVPGYTLTEDDRESIRRVSAINQTTETKEAA